MTNQRRFGVGIAIIAALLVAVVLQWRHVVQRRQVDRVEVAFEQATTIRLWLARAALNSARLTSGDPTVTHGDAEALLDVAQLALRDWTYGRAGSVGVRTMPPLADSTLRPLATSLEEDLRRYRTSIGSRSAAARVDERSLYGAVAARADSIFFFTNTAVLQQRRVDDRAHAISVAAAVFTIVLLAGILSRLTVRADVASARSGALRSLAETLAAARAPIDVARGTRRVIGDALGSVHGETVLAREDRLSFDVIEKSGAGSEAIAAGHGGVPTPSPLVARALASHEVTVLESPDMHLPEALPHERTLSALGVRTVAALPLVATIDGTMRTMGATTFDFESGRRFDDGDRLFLTAVANVTAQAMARALATQSVETARGEAQRERARLGEILDRLPVGVIVMDEAQAVVHRNSALARLLGREVTEAAHVWSAASQADGATYAPGAHPLARALREDRAIDHELTRYRRHDGSTAFLRFSVAPLRFDGGVRRAVVATIEEVSELHRAQAALEESEARFRTMAEELPVGIYRTDPKGRVSYVNPRAAELYGADASTLHAYDWLRLVHPDERERVVRDGEAWRVGGVTRARFQFRIVRASDGQTRRLATEIAHLRDASGALAGMLGVLEDVTERDSLEAQLRQAQKMEAVGRLAGGIAHDFNNLLTVIGGISDLMLQGSLASEARTDIEQIRDSSKRAADLTRQLLTFSRQQALRIGQVDIDYVVEQSLKFIRRVIGEHIEVTVARGERLPMARADAGAVEQVLMNLVVNARDAMPDGGQLRIRTQLCVGGHPTAPPRESASAGFVCIDVSDNGSGIDPAIINQIFDPFFTTKEVGRGTGLGLSMVYGLVEQMEGWIDVDSTVGAGTTFRIHLPIADVRSESAPALTSLGAVARGTETVLLVEDEPAVRRLAHRTLTQLGYVVLDAPDARSALQLASGHPHIDMLVTDVVLPGRSGASLADELLAERPGLRILFMSGYTSDDALRRRLADGVPFLAKPYTPTSLARRVREVLDGAPTAA